MLVCRQLSLTHAGLGKLNPSGVRPTSLINVWSQKVFFCHSVLHLYSSHCATLMSDQTGSFCSSSGGVAAAAAGGNECLDLRCYSCPLNGDRSPSCEVFWLLSTAS